MKKLHYILILLFISVDYLFSQSEGNELIKVDTVVIIQDTVVVIHANRVVMLKVDTVVVEEIINEQGETVEVKNYLYKDYLEYVKKTGGDANILATKRDKIGIALLQAGIDREGRGLFYFSLGVPIFDNYYVTPKYIYAPGVSDRDRHRIYAITFGYCSFMDDNALFKISIGTCYLDSATKWMGGGWFLYTDMGFHYRISKYVAMSFNIDFTGIMPNSYSLGLGITPKLCW